MGFIRYPDPPTLVAIDSKDALSLRLWQNQLIDALNRRDSTVIFGAANAAPYWQLTTVSINRVFDVSSATTAKIAVALGTLLNDLKKKGVIS